MRVGHQELRVPQDRTGRFSTELFESYQGSERAGGGAGGMYVQGEADPDQLGPINRDPGRNPQLGFVFRGDLL